MAKRRKSRRKRSGGRTGSIEGKYQVLDQSKYRGLAGFGMGGVGTTLIAMRNALTFNSVAIGGAGLDFRKYLESPFKEAIITAAITNNFQNNADWRIRFAYASAVSYCPDSTTKPILGRLPFSAEGVFIDSVWNKWLSHDPYTLLHLYKDTIKRLGDIHMFIKESDLNHLTYFETFHQALLDLGIEHGYLIDNKIDDLISHNTT